MQVNRVVAGATALLGLVAAAAPVAANMDWQSTAGVIGGIGAVALVSYKWLDGWQKAEDRGDPGTLPNLKQVRR
jgi:hypothetical protein